MDSAKPPVILSYIGQIENDCEGKKPDIRERALKCGVKSLSTAELLMLLLGSGTKDLPVQKLARDVLACIQSRGGQITVDRLMGVRGISTGKAACIAAAFELGRRLFSCQGEIIRVPKDLLPFVQHYALQKQEHFLCASLTGAHEIIALRVVSVGTLNNSLIHPREVFADPLKDRCAAVILCHNHPSGVARASREDMLITSRMKRSAEILGIRLLDHLIITRENYFSFSESGML